MNSNEESYWYERISENMERSFINSTKEVADILPEIYTHPFFKTLLDISIIEDIVSKLNRNAEQEILFEEITLDEYLELVKKVKENKINEHKRWLHQDLSSSFDLAIKEMYNLYGSRLSNPFYKKEATIESLKQYYDQYQPELLLNRIRITNPDNYQAISLFENLYNLYGTIYDEILRYEYISAKSRHIM